MGLTDTVLGAALRKTGSATNGMLPKEWIERFVVSQAKRLIETNPHLSLKKIAMDLGFTEHSTFYRYFHLVVGIYPQGYKNALKDSQEEDMKNGR